jgi:hypothetical protein
MTPKPEKPMEDATVLVVDVVYGSGGLRLEKPRGAPPEQYTIGEVDGEPALYISEHLKFPIYLQFDSNIAITGVGFAEKPPVEIYEKAGPCGGGFVLVDDLDKTELVSKLIANPGIQTKDGSGYHFDLEFAGQKSGIDPRIYNHGQPQLPWWRRLFLALKRFLSWLLG